MKNALNLPYFTNKLFDVDTELLPSVTELFELELAYLEYNSLEKNCVLARSAYFKKYCGQLTNHFLLYSDQLNEIDINEERSVNTKAYFENGQFATGYATHGLFPYRGKFHPQLIKGLINIIGIEKGDILLDPMCGSGTLNIEASLLGIESYAVDVSPFCQFMTKVKYESLTIDPNLLNEIKLNAFDLFAFFKKTDFQKKIHTQNTDKIKIYNLALLAFLDALGYSKRVVKSNHEQLFEKVLKRYINTVINFTSNPHFKKNDFANIQILNNSEALKIELRDNSIDGIITSPPYSFAIDYVENDKDQLEFLGYDALEIKSKMIGLKGKTKIDKLNNYFTDMDKFCSEVSRLLKKEKKFVMIIGSNTNQTGGIRLENAIIDSALKYNLKLVKSILKPIKGMRNIMKDEYVLIFEKK